MSQGLTVMIIGMATVFAFLVLLIFQSKVLHLFVKNAHKVENKNDQNNNNDLRKI